MYLFRYGHDGKQFTKDEREIWRIDYLKYAGHQYELVSSVVHVGDSPYSGHYVTYFPRYEPVRKFDDNGGGDRPATFEPVKENEYFKAESKAYVFLYRKIETPETMKESPK